ILVAAKEGTEQGKVKVAAMRKQVEDEVAKEMAKLPAGTDNLAREKARMQATDKAFAALAAKESTCPSKDKGGDLGWFGRAGQMIEPFARAAFALKPYQMSDAVVTDYGCHLILAVDTKPGREVKFEDVKPFVQEVYAERLREAIVNAYRPK